MSVPVVVLDACVLYPAALRDLLMRLAVHGLLQPKWTDTIHEEWMEAVLRVRPDIKRDDLERTRRLMDLHASDSLVNGYQHHQDNLHLPDPDDRHVLAAAIEAGADTLLTWNLKDFPSEALRPHDVVAENPDTFLSRLLESRRDEFLYVVRQARASLRNPPLTAANYLETLRTQRLVNTCASLESFLSEL